MQTFQNESQNGLPSSRVENEATLRTEVFPSIVLFIGDLFKEATPIRSPSVVVVITPPEGRSTILGSIDGEALTDALDTSIEEELQRHDYIYRSDPDGHLMASASVLSRRATLITAPEMNWEACAVRNPDGHTVAVLVGVDREQLDRLPGIDVHGRGELDGEETAWRVTFAHSLQAAVVQSLAKEFQQDATPSYFFRPRDKGNVLRRAGESYIQSLAEWFHLNHFGAVFENLFDQFNQIASLPYEGADSYGAIVFMSDEEAATSSALKFLKPVPMSESRWARKMLELSTRSLAIAAKGREIHSLVPRSHAATNCISVEFTGKNQWDLRYRNESLMVTRFGIPKIRRPPIEEGFLDAMLQEIFGSSEIDGSEIWRLHNDVVRLQSHGALMVVCADAAYEAARLAGDGARIEVKPLGEALIESVTRIDGAILLDPMGRCHAIGVILDGTTTVPVNQSRGSRYNSAHRYVNSPTAAPRFAVVVSEDGGVDLLQRSRT